MGRGPDYLLQSDSPASGRNCCWQSASCNADRTSLLPPGDKGQGELSPRDFAVSASLSLPMWPSQGQSLAYRQSVPTSRGPSILRPRAVAGPWLSCFCFLFALLLPFLFEQDYNSKRESKGITSWSVDEWRLPSHQRLRSSSSTVSLPSI